MVKSTGTDQVEIFWDPPKGEFKKYTLLIEKIGELIKNSEPKVINNNSKTTIARRNSTSSDPNQQSDIAGTNN